MLNSQTRLFWVLAQVILHVWKIPEAGFHTHIVQQTTHDEHQTLNHWISLKTTVFKYIIIQKTFKMLFKNNINNWRKQELPNKSKSF